jgi:hypothetical protein
MVVVYFVVPLFPHQQHENNVDDEDFVSSLPSVFTTASRLTKEGTILFQKRSPGPLTDVLSARPPEGLLVLSVAVSGVLPTLSSVASIPENAAMK